MTHYDFLAWLGTIFVLLSAYLNATKKFPLAYYVSIISAITLGVYSYLNDSLPLVILDIALFCIYVWGIIKHDK